jgi:hypothetical protein
VLISVHVPVPRGLAGAPEYPLQAQKQRPQRRGRGSAKRNPSLQVGCNEECGLLQEDFRVAEVLDVDESCQGGDASTVALHALGRFVPKSTTIFVTDCGVLQAKNR